MSKTFVGRLSVLENITQQQNIKKIDIITERNKTGKPRPIHKPRSKQRSSEKLNQPSSVPAERNTVSETCSV